MSDSAERKAIEILDRAGLTGESPVYAQLLASITTAIRLERDLFMATNRKLHSDWYDSADGQAYADELGERMMQEWMALA